MPRYQEVRIEHWLQSLIFLTHSSSGSFFRYILSPAQLLFFIHFSCGYVLYRVMLDFLFCNWRYFSFRYYANFLWQRQMHLVFLIFSFLILHVYKCVLKVINIIIFLSDFPGFMPGQLPLSSRMHRSKIFKWRMNLCLVRQDLPFYLNTGY